MGQRKNTADPTGDGTLDEKREHGSSGFAAIPMLSLFPAVQGPVCAKSRMTIPDRPHPSVITFVRPWASLP